jgi:hypothetical protein
VYDPIQKEIIKGSVCTLKNGSKSFKKETDGFGDFWFEGLAEGTYSLTIEAYYLSIIILSIIILSIIIKNRSTLNYSHY